MLIRCIECYQKISDKSPNCVHCGYPNTSVKKKGVGHIIETIIIISVWGFVIYWLFFE